MSFCLSFLSRGQSQTLSALDESITKFSESLREKDFDPIDGDRSLNNSRRASLELSQFMSMRSLDKGNDGCPQTIHSVTRVFDDIDLSNSGRISLLDELKPTPEVPLEETHGKEINARKIFVRETRKSRESTFATPRFNEDLRKLLDTTACESRRISAQSDMTDDLAPVQKKVTFIDVTIREYPIIVGDNPAGTGGPPLTIGWKHVSSVDLDIDKYEEARAGNRRKQQEIQMKQDYRKQLLRSLGFSLAEMQKGTKAANIVRNRRRHVNAVLYKDASNEIAEKVVRRFVSIATLGYKKRKEKKYLRKTLPNYEEHRSSKRALKTQGSTASGESTGAAAPESQ
jgi:hypothetical protein